MDKMTTTETSNARMMGRFVGSAAPGSRARRTLVKGLFLGGVVILLGVLSFAAGKTTTVRPTRPSAATPRKDVRVADRIHQQGPRSHRMVPFQVTQSGIIEIQFQVFNEGEVEFLLVPGSESENCENTLSNPLFGPGYRHYPGFSGKVEGGGRMRGYLEPGMYSVVLLNKAWFSDIKTWTVVVQNPTL